MALRRRAPPRRPAQTGWRRAGDGSGCCSVTRALGTLVAAAGILGNQNKLDPVGATSYIYMQPLGGVNTKPWGKSDYGFPCCW